MNRSKQLSRLLPRDGYVCGIHIDGCGQLILNRADATVDHIFTRSFFNEREDGIKPKDYNRDLNCQPMHHECNNRRGGQIYGFPLFACSCHWLRIVKTPLGYVLVQHYRTDVEEFVFPVSTEDHRFFFDNRSTGKFSAEFGGAHELQINSAWSMGRLKPGKKGITGKGQLGHALPRISPDEVPEFNQLEMQRITGQTKDTIEKFNRRMDPMRMQVIWEAV